MMTTNIAAMAILAIRQALMSHPPDSMLSLAKRYHNGRGHQD
jgi:hypothetical protein